MVGGPSRTTPAGREGPAPPARCSALHGHLDQSEQREHDSGGHRQLSDAGQPPAASTARPRPTEPGSRAAIVARPVGMASPRGRARTSPARGSALRVTHRQGRKTAPRRDDTGPTAVPSVLPCSATIEVRGLRKRYGAHGRRRRPDLHRRARPGHRVRRPQRRRQVHHHAASILGLDAPDEGRRLVGGRPYRSLRDAARQVGALLDAAAVHPAARPRPPAVAGPVATACPPRVDEVLEQVG